MVSVAILAGLSGSEQREDRGQSGHPCQPSLSTCSSDPSFHKPSFDVNREGFHHPAEACYYCGNEQDALPMIERQLGEKHV